MIALAASVVHRCRGKGSDALARRSLMRVSPGAGIVQLESRTR
jgi:hypothetical protein